MTPEINQLLDWQPNAELATVPTVSAESHRYGMRHFAIGVSIITARHGESRAGLTATAVCSVTADPPRLVVFVNKNVVANDVVLNSGALCVNVLAGDQEDVAKAFAGMIDGVHGDARFAALEKRILDRVLQKPDQPHAEPAWPGIAAHGLRWAI